MNSESAFPTLCLAPMAGFTDAAMRSTAIRFGAPVCFTEMVSAQGLVYGNRKTDELLQRMPNEKKFIVQIFGKRPEPMAQAAEIVQKKTGSALAGIDINMGCPAPKINRNGEGCALMILPDTAVSIVRAVRAACDVPVSVKFRSGIDDRHVNAPEFARILEDAGADRLTVHPRTRTQQYAGEADWMVLRDVVRAVSVPVTGSGDVRSGEDALRMLQETGCDSVMVGRAAVGNPYIFSEIQAALGGKEFRPPTDAERIGVLLEHFSMMLALKGTKRGILEMRAHMPKYLRGMRGACELRVELFQLSNPSEIRDKLLRYQDAV